MAVKDQSNTLIDAQVATRSTRSGLYWPAKGLQPSFYAIMNMFFHLDQAVPADFQVRADDANTTTIRVMPGRCTVAGTSVAFGGSTVNLASANNTTTKVWAIASGGAATIAFGAAWPGGTHKRLALVTLVAGEITNIVDLRFENNFTL